MTHKSPRVSIGVPVYNGENFLADALESLLAQTFQDFEIIISDNGSTDRTAEICAEFVARDARIRYHRNEHDIGPCLNFNRTVDLASAPYFKWAAHDDLLDPAFLETCVAALDQDEDVILAFTLTRIIDEHGNDMALYDSRLRGARGPVQSRRFASLILQQHICTEMFGLMRIEALRASRRLEGNYHGCDRAMLAELALIGRFGHTPKPLFLNREHTRRYVRAVAPEERVGHHHAAARARIGMHSWSLYADYWRAVNRHADGVGNRLRCYGHLLLWWFVGWNSLRIGTELIAQVFPRFYDYAKATKNRYVRPAHPVATHHDSK